MNVVLDLLRRTLPMILAAAVLSTPAIVNAADRWCVVPFTNRGVDPGEEETFLELLASELRSRGGMSLSIAQVLCGDEACARKIGAEHDADVVLFGYLGTLGEKVVVTATAVDVGTGELRGSHKMTLGGPGELDSAAARIVEAVLSARTVDDTAELGSITEQESAKPTRRRGHQGPSLRVGALTPLNDGYPDTGGGVLLDGSIWYEAYDFAIEPRLGLRFGARKSGDGAAFFEMPMDVGAYWILGLGDFAVLLGGGAGLRYQSEKRPAQVVTGAVIRTEHEALKEDSAWAFGYFARAGVLLFRTYSWRMAVTVDYNAVTVGLNDAPAPQSITAGLALIL